MLLFILKKAFLKTIALHDEYLFNAIHIFARLIQNYTMSSNI